MRKKEKKPLEQKIDEVLQIFKREDIAVFFDTCYQLLELFHVTPEDDWVRDRLAIVEKEDLDTVRLMRTVYILSKMADAHAVNLCKIAWEYKGLYREMEEHIKNEEN